MEDYPRQHASLSEIQVIPQVKDPVYDGLSFPKFLELMTDTEKKITAIKNLESRSDDILICAYPKSGTHWVCEIVAQIISGKAEYSERSKGGLFLEAQPLGELAELPSPRSLNSHLPFRMLPRKHFRLKAKTILVIRNPKDVAVSLFHHSQKDTRGGMIGKSWEEFFQTYIDNKLIECGIRFTSSEIIRKWLLKSQDQDSFIFDYVNSKKRNEVFDDLYEKEMKDSKLRITFNK
ncbi:hypothetical protein KUTeg_023171 [Tegillarca granosa]|uniref:Sulfotransferase domain-containing protein n=1 Tax=Tegillarca granosa TaxID=220873 RepID=A0ABQ9E5U1_TEGGR|nr:hypothetical protein KUTeg_023171 [Tegillarca granosa]